MRNISVYSLKKASEHVYYEVGTFFDINNKLKFGKITDQASINIFLDAYIIHLRNLFNFLYPPKNIKDDDIIVYDYIADKKRYEIEKTKKREIKFILKKAHKQVCHLTYSRNRYSGTRKGWQWDIIGLMLHRSLSAFYNSLAPNRGRWQYFIQLKIILDNYMEVTAPIR